MTIQYEGYQLEQNERRFDLIRHGPKTRKDRKGNIVKVREFIGYGYTYEGVIQAMILDKMCDNKEIVTLQEFIQAYRDEVNKLKQAIAL